jgi:hypothetical protein
MNPGNWIALLSVLVALFALGLTMQFRVLDNKQREITELKSEKREAELKTEKAEALAQSLRDANFDLKIALSQLSGTAAAVDRTLSALPIQRTEGNAP